MSNPNMKRGARPSPRHKLQAAPPHIPIRAHPAQWPNVLPSWLEMWLNDVDGICVTAEGCAAFALYSVVNGLPELKITDATELAFANKYGFVNGANLTDVMDKMISDGFHQDGVTYNEGSYSGVDYSNEDVLQNAIFTGPVSIAVDANALPSNAGSVQGWTAFGGIPNQFPNTDHCIGIWVYGPMAFLVQLIQKTFNVTINLPSKAPAKGYIVYTWSTVGIVDHAWLMSTCAEAWVRTPTLVGVNPVPPPTPPPGPAPMPIPGGGTYTLVTNSDGSLVFTPSSGGPIAITPDTTVQELIDAMGAGSGVISITIPPFILRLLKIICPFAGMVPPPYGPILVALCAAIPHAVMGADGSAAVTVSQETADQIAAFKSSPQRTLVAGEPQEVKQVEDWLRGLNSFPCAGCK